MTLQEKLDQFRKAQMIIDNFHKELLTIILKTENSCATDIIDVNIQDKNLSVAYRAVPVVPAGDRLFEHVSIPTYWLEEGFDYVEDKRKLDLENERLRKLKAEAAKRQEEANRDARDLAEYERLRKKFKGV